MSGRDRRRAAALRYEGVEAPRLVASGRDLIADRIVAAAREAGVPVKEDPVLVQALETLELDDHIPPELYVAVAEALAWAYRLTDRDTVRPHDRHTETGHPHPR